MLPKGFWEQQSGVKALYQDCTAPVCEQFSLTRIELDVLLFLANNPEHDTPAELCDLRHLSKSQVSGAVKALQEKELLTRFYLPGNRKTTHLRLLTASAPIVQAGQAAQARFASVLLRGFSVQELETMQAQGTRIRQNIDAYFREESK